jgi:ribitol 2-dehydrogenase
VYEAVGVVAAITPWNFPLFVNTEKVVSALLADWPEEHLRKAKESGSLIEPSEVADAVEYMLTRNRNVTIRDMLVLPTNFDRV